MAFPPDNLDTRFRHGIELQNRIRYVICQGGKFDKKEFKRNVAGSGAYAPWSTVVTLLEVVLYYLPKGLSTGIDS